MIVLGPSDRLHDPIRRVRRELSTAVWVEASDRNHEPTTSFLNHVVKIETPLPEALRNTHDQPKIAAEERITGGHVASRYPAGELLLLGRGQQLPPADLAEQRGFDDKS